MEPADVQHLMLAPVDRGAPLRRPARRSGRLRGARGLVVGGLAGSLFHQRLPGSSLGGSLGGALSVPPRSGSPGLRAGHLLADPAPLAAADHRLDHLLLGHRRRGRRRADLAGRPTSGKMLFWPLEFSAIAPSRSCSPSSSRSSGARVIGGLSVEQARRRTALVGQLRFAVTQQDLRSVVLLRRNLASRSGRGTDRGSGGCPSLVARRLPDRRPGPPQRRPLAHRAHRAGAGPRQSPPASPSGGCGPGPLHWSWSPGWRSTSRGSTATEPLAQEVDHPQITEWLPDPDRRDAVPPSRAAGDRDARRSVSSGSPRRTSWTRAPTCCGSGWVVVLTGALAGVAGATVSTVSGAFVDTSQSMMMPPEVAGPGMVIKHRLAASGRDHRLPARAVRPSRRPRRVRIPCPSPMTVAIPVLVLVSIIFGWVRFRDDLHDSMAEATGGSKR